MSFLAVAALVVASIGVPIPPQVLDAYSVDVGWGWAADDPTPAPGAVVYEDRLTDGHCVYAQTAGVGGIGIQSGPWACYHRAEVPLRPGDTHYRLCRTGRGGVCSGWVKTLGARGVDGM